VGARETQYIGIIFYMKLSLNLELDTDNVNDVEKVEQLLLMLEKLKALMEQTEK
jgi:hypothetical protein